MCACCWFCLFVCLRVFLFVSYYFCYLQWEEQHESLTCERFRAWKAANDPELQQAGVAALLAKNGLGWF